LKASYSYIRSYIHFLRLLKMTWHRLKHLLLHIYLKWHY